MDGVALSNVIELVVDVHLAPALREVEELLLRRVLVVVGLLAALEHVDGKVLQADQLGFVGVENAELLGVSNYADLWYLNLFIRPQFFRDRKAPRLNITSVDCEILASSDSRSQ